MKKTASLILAAVLVFCLVTFSFADSTTVEPAGGDQPETETAAPAEVKTGAAEADTEQETKIYTETFAPAEQAEIPAEEAAVFECDVTVPEDVTLSIAGSAEFRGKLDVYGVLCIEDGASVSISKDSKAVFHSEKDEDGNVVSASELVNHGQLCVEGRLTLEDGVTFAGTNNAIVCMGDGKVEGTSHKTGSDTEEKITLTKAEFDALAAPGELKEDKSYILTESITVKENSMLTIKSGSITVPEGLSVTVKGALIIEGGSLEFEKGAKLDNDFFITVKDAGRLTLRSGAEYDADDSSAIVWNQTAENSTAVISGVPRKWIDCSVNAGTIGEFRQAVLAAGYHTLTVNISDPDYVTSVEIPEGVTVCLK